MNREFKKKKHRECEFEKNNVMKIVGQIDYICDENRKSMFALETKTEAKLFGFGNIGNDDFYYYLICTCISFRLADKMISIKIFYGKRGVIFRKYSLKLLLHPSNPIVLINGNDSKIH